MAEDEEAGVDEVPDLQLLLDPSSGDFDPEFEFAALPLATGEVVEIVLVARIDTKLLVVVPASAWHRQIAKRILPPQALTKVTSVEVQQCSQVDRTEATEGSMRVWMGFLQEDLASQVVSGDAVETVDHQFLCGDLPGYLPYGQSLVDVAQDHFSFLSAVEGPPDKALDASGGVDVSVEARMQRMEDAMEKMGVVISQLATDRGQRFDETTTRPSALRSKKVAAAQVEKFPALDAAVVSSAISAGVSEEALL